MEETDFFACPNCEYEFEYEDASGVITLHGEGGPKNIDCPECGATLAVTEVVERTWDVDLLDDLEVETDEYDEAESDE